MPISSNKIWHKQYSLIHEIIEASNSLKIDIDGEVVRSSTCEKKPSPVVFAELQVAVNSATSFSFVAASSLRIVMLPDKLGDNLSIVPFITESSHIYNRTLNVGFNWQQVVLPWHLDNPWYHNLLTYKYIQYIISCVPHFAQWQGQLSNLVVMHALQVFPCLCKDRQ